MRLPGSLRDVMERNNAQIVDTNLASSATHRPLEWQMGNMLTVLRLVVQVLMI
jgi:hypothetical protein